MAAVPMRDNLAPKKVLNPSIIKPPIQENNFDVKATLLQLVQGNQFGGGATENPNEHLNEFLDSCDMFKAFLNKYFPPQRTARIKSELQGFTQQDDETLYEAWERYKGLQRLCPHHEIGDDELINNFYEGLNNEMKMNLDSGSGKGELDKIDHKTAKELIEEMASRTFHWNNDRHKRKGKSTVESANNVEVKGLIEELKQQIALLNSSNTSRNSSSNWSQMYCCDICGDQGHPPNECPLMMGEANCIEQVNGVWESIPARQAFNNNQHHPGMRARPNFSHGSQNVQNPTFQLRPQFQPLNQPTNPQFQQNSQPFQQNSQPFPQSTQLKSNMEPMIEQLMNSQTQFITHSNQKQEEATSSINQLRTQMQASQRMTDNQISQLASQISQFQASNGKFSGKTEENPKTINAIHWKSGRELEDRVFIKRKKSRKPEVVVEPPKVVEDDLVEVVVETPMLVDESTKVVDEPTKVVEEPKQQVVRPYVPPIPFPQRLARAKLEQKYGKFMHMMKGVNIPMPFIDAIKEIPAYGKFLKELISNKNSLSPSTTVNLSKECSAILMNGLPQKLEDPDFQEVEGI
ncbi:uncharacterized protein LOC141655073 [Silene latifolia]|uniref:uncharacterized protein LOC141655073 n=1 Tax=Silene latifolia TaxID=37657 RepID=UPI003D76E398